MLHYKGYLARHGHTDGIRFTIGSGLAYWDRPFNLEYNFNNSAIGSRITWALQGRIGYQKDITSYGGIDLETGVGIFHCSNGAFRLPNLGLNVPQVYLNISFPTQGKHSASPMFRVGEMKTAKYIWPVDTIKWDDTGLQFWASGAAGFKMADYAPSKLYSAYTGRVSGLWRVSARSGFTLGLDWIHHRALKAEAEFYNEPKARDFNRIGLAAGHDWFIARGIAITTQVGVYLRNPAPGVHKPYYQRYGVRFNTAGRISPAVLFRAHLGQADCVEWTVAYRLYSNNR